MKKLILILVAFILVGSGCQKETDVKDQNTPAPANTEGGAEEGQSLVNGVFNDTESGITFNVPTGAEYFESDFSGEKTISRIQNYDPKGPDKLGLSETEYYIELTIDYTEDSTIPDCSTLTSAEMVEVDGGTRYMGYPNQGGDSGGERYAICFKGEGPDYYLQVTENNEEHPVREMIKESFRS